MFDVPIKAHIRVKACIVFGSSRTKYSLMSLQNDKLKWSLASKIRTKKMFERIMGYLSYKYYDIFNVAKLIKMSGYVFNTKTGYIDADVAYTLKLPSRDEPKKNIETMVKISINDNLLNGSDTWHGNDNILHDGGKEFERTIYLDFNNIKVDKVQSTCSAGAICFRR